MKRIWLLTALFLAAMPAQAQQHGNGGVATSPGPSNFPTRQTPVIGGAEGTAEDLAVAGHCDKAVPILRRLTGGASFALARYHLGQCLFTLADTERDASRATALRREGAQWMLSSADAGFARAEAEAVAICTDGVGMEKDPVEAEKWALLYRHNSMRFVFNLPDIDPDVSARLDAALTAPMRAEAESRANAWNPRTRAED